MTSTSQLLALKLAPPPEGRGCEEEVGRSYEVVPSVVCSMCCLFGIIYCFFGYRCFKAVLFLTGLLFGTAVIFLLCHKERVLDSVLGAEASLGVALAVGTLCGLVTMLVRSVGLFTVGLLLGLLGGVAALVVMEEFYHPRTVWVPLAVLLGSGTLFAVLALRWQRLLVTLSTAVSGAAVITVAADYFVELLAVVRLVHERLRVAPPRPVCPLTWGVLGAWPVLALLGALVQWKVTAEGYSHTELVVSRQQRRLQLMRIQQREERMEKEERRKKRKKKQNHKSQSQSQKPPQQYHHPAPPRPRPQGPALRPSQPPKSAPAAEPPGYGRKSNNPVRRYDGDVLSPSYLRGFRERELDRRAYPADRLMSRERMSQLDYDCGSQVPLTAPSGPAARV